MGKRELTLLHYPSGVPIQLEITVSDMTLADLRGALTRKLASSPNCLMKSFTKWYYSDLPTGSIYELLMHFPSTWRNLWRRSRHSRRPPIELPSSPTCIVLHLEGPLLSAEEIAKRQVEALKHEESYARWLLAQYPQRPLKAVVCALKDNMSAETIMKTIINSEGCGVNKSFRSQRRANDIAMKLYSTNSWVTSVILFTPLVAATFAGRVDLMRHLLASGANGLAIEKIEDCPNTLTKNPLSVSALEISVTQGNIPVIEFLASQGADLKLLSNGQSCMHMAGYISGKTIECLINMGQDVNARGEDGSTPLYNALCKKNYDATDTLIRHGTDLNNEAKVEIPPQSPPRSNVLFRFANTIRLVNMLLDAGADLETRTCEGWTPLHFAASHVNNFSHIRHLINIGADVSAKTNDLESALHIAATDLTTTTTEILLKHKLDIDARDINGRTPLQNALCASTMSGSTNSVLRLLLAEGASVDLSQRGRSKVIGRIRGQEMGNQALLAIDDLGGWCPNSLDTVCQEMGNQALLAIDDLGGWCPNNLDIV